jgi:hypothetical protein
MMFSKFPLKSLIHPDFSVAAVSLLLMAVVQTPLNGS